MSGNDRGIAALAEAPKPTAVDGNGAGEKAKRAPKKDLGSKTQSVYDITVFAVGQTPLLVDQYQKDQMVDDLIFKKKKPKDTETPLEKRAANTVYRDDKNTIILPANMLFACLCRAGNDVSLQGKKKLANAGGANSRIPNFLRILGGQNIALLLPDGSPVTEDDWQVDVRKAVGSDGKTATAPVRALFPEWAFKVGVRVDISKVEGLTLALVRQLFNAAGDSYGVGSHRTKGGFGRFVIAEGGWIISEVDESNLARPKAPVGLMSVPEGTKVVEQS